MWKRGFPERGASHILSADQQSLESDCMTRRYLAIFALSCWALFSATYAKAVNECPDCVERKKQMCAQECSQVAASKAQKCQTDCVRQYCRHRCEADDPALKGLLNPECDDCLDQQFNLCNTECPTGTDRIRALCKLDCAKKRCRADCPGESTHFFKN